MSIQKEPLFLEALPVMQQLVDAGYEAYFVGGSVRDMLLHKPISDVDIATSATPQEVKEIFLHTVDVGIEHGTVMVIYHKEGYEVTTFRTEEGYEDFRHPDKVTFVRSLEEDLKRRDFTINALAIGIDDQLIDFFDGIGDLERQCIRCVGDAKERFNEDALRMFRAVRFVGQLGFQIEEETKNAISLLKMNLSKVAVERMKVEFEKMIQSSYRKDALKLFVETGLYQACPLFDGKGEILLKLAEFPIKEMSVLQAWILFVDELKLSDKEVTHLLKSWKSSNEQIRDVLVGYRTYRARKEEGWNFFLAYDCPYEVACEVEQLLIVQDKSSSMEGLEATYHSLPIRSMNDIHLNGHDIIRILKLDKKGPIIGQVLKTVEKMILEKSISNDAEVLETYVLSHFRGKSV
ncbi:CCA tRNA nucleotidyltransferase [uncultured Granulicatella sp.]|uniref:CCA tRNA nucleotidyltransferase n=1 Tax=uncultured Granulicatella sp. TaxID=316089 RepID=UPI0028D80A07|nr:CCA tRNA nucleotidyltransferase [uncultured Granulicatella sp.]